MRTVGLSAWQISTLTWQLSRLEEVAACSATSPLTTITRSPKWRLSPARQRAGHLMALASEMTGRRWPRSTTADHFATEIRSRRVASDFDYPLSTGKRVPTVSFDGLCRGCAGAWP